MKGRQGRLRSIARVSMALVLAVSLSLVAVLPAAAATTFNVIPFTLTGPGDGDAAWSTVQARGTSTSSVLLDSGTDDGSNTGRIKITVPAIAMASFTGARFYTYQPAASTQDAGAWTVAGSTATYTAWPWGTPYINILIDFDGNGTVDDKLEGVGAAPVAAVTWPTYADTWTQMEEIYFYDQDDSMSAGLGYGPPLHELGDQASTLAAWKTWFAANHPTYTVVGIEITFGYWGVAQTGDVYVDDPEINGVTYQGLIQDAIDGAAAGDTISVAAGTYVERFDVDKQLTLTGAGVTSIVRPASAPGVNPDVHVTSTGGGTIIQDFLFDFNDGGTRSGNGLWVNAANVQIRDNTIELGEGGGATATDEGIGIAAPIGGTVTGLIIDGNIFVAVSVADNSDDGGTGIWLEGTATALSPITVSDNTFSGDLYVGVGVATNNVDILNNTLTGSDAAVGEGFGIGLGVDQAGLTLDDITIDGNTIDTFGTAIDVLAAQAGTSVTATITKNTIMDSGEGVYAIGNSTTPSTLTVNYNSITGNGDGVSNDGDVTIDAEYNWWGGVAGPNHAGNPYQGEANTQVNDTVVGTGTVDFLPWLIHDTLVAGWNIWSTPVAPATGAAGEPDTNTIAEALDFWTADSSKVIGTAYYFDSATQLWAVASTLTPMQPVYLKLSAAATIDVAVSDGNYAPPGRIMHLGWNLVGPASLDEDMHVDVALLAAEFGTGQVGLLGYQYVISPSIGQASWTYISGAGYVDEDFIPTEGYWVYMLNQGILNGFTYTPILAP